MLSYPPKSPVPILAVVFATTLAACATSTSERAPADDVLARTRISSQDLEALAASVSKLKDEVALADRHGAVILHRSVDLQGARFEFVRAERRWMTIYDLGDSTVFEQRIELGQGSLRAAEAWRVRSDGRIERFGPDDFLVTRDAVGNGHATLRWPALEPEDLLGWSVTVRETQGRGHQREPLSFDLPVVRGRVRVSGDALLTHRVLARNVDHLDVTVEITDRVRGFPHTLTVNHGTLPVRSHHAFALPPLLREPFLEVTRQGRFYQELDTWILGNDWDLWIALELGDPADWIERTPQLRELARSLTAGASTDREWADALHRFVRDEIRTLDPGVDEKLFPDANLANNLDLAEMEREFDEEADSFLAQRFRDEKQLRPAGSEVSNPTLLRPQRGPGEVLAARAGTRLEKTVLLASLFAAVDLEPRITFARDRDWGPFDHDSTGSWQFTDAFVVLLTPDLRPDLWYCVTREGLPAGVLPVSLQGVTMLSVRDGFTEELAGLWDRARATASSRVELRVPEWVRNLRAAGWATWSRTPGVPDDPCAALEETTRWEGEGETLRLVVRTKGEIGLERDSYAQERYPNARAIEVLDFTTPSPESIRQHALSAELSVQPLPAAEDGVWALAARSVFGEGPLADWERDAQVFHVGRTTDHAWRSELSLPDGWTAIERVPVFRVQHDRLVYEARTSTVDGTLVIERGLRLVAGTSPNADVVDPISNLLLFESGTLVIRRALADSDRD